MHETPAPVDLWEEIGSCEHLVQFYDDSHTLVESLSGFIGSSLRANAAGIVIATEQHLQALEQQLAASGIDIVAAKSRGQYVPLGAGRLSRECSSRSAQDRRQRHHHLGQQGRARPARLQRRGIHRAAGRAIRG